MTYDTIFHSVSLASLNDISSTSVTSASVSIQALAPQLSCDPLYTSLLGPSMTTSLVGSYHPLHSLQYALFTWIIVGIVFPIVGGE